MITEPVTRNGRSALPESLPASEERALRELAIKQVERVRNFKLHLVAFLLGTVLLTTVWVLTEYFEERTWPDRFADSPDLAGTWSPWLFWAVGIWALVVVVQAFRTYAHRPPSEAEIQREIDRLRARA
ncbi:MAG TPA: 2TM domain-containing protein [Gaiellaceae bacterium]|nr:2TM domain-containing protein [Gaiellaceae bacterium]